MRLLRKDPMRTTMVQGVRLLAAIAVTGMLGACATRGTVVADPATRMEPLDRSIMPREGATPEYDFPDVQRRTLSNGLEVWLVERPGVPLVTMNLIVDAGALADPADRPGLASLTAEMLTEGTRTRTAEQIADEVEFLAMSIGASAGLDVSSVSLSTLVRNLDAALAIFADVVANPAFPEREWPRVRDERLVSLRRSQDQPATIATEELARRVYGESHPLGRRIQGTAASVRATTPDALREFHRIYYRPNNAHIVVVGDVRAERVVQQLEAAFTGWTRAHVPPVGLPAEPAAGMATRVFLLDRPGAAQSQIRIGHVGVARAHADYFPLLVMNTLLGGQFTSRINLNLREDKGYTYGARSGFNMGRLAGPFVAQAGVESSVTKESIVEFMRELEEIRNARPATEEEVEFARTSIIRREPLTLETNGQIANRIRDLILFGLPLDYFDEYNQRVAAVTRDDVNRVARQYLQPGRVAIVVVGDRANIERQLRELPYPVEVVPVRPEPQAVIDQTVPRGR